MSAPPDSIEATLAELDEVVEPVWRLQALVGALALAALVAESTVGYLLFTGRLSPVAALAGHAGVTLVILAVALWHRRGKGRAMPALALLVVCVGLLGPLGALGSLITLVIHALTYRNAERFEDWYQALFPEEETDEQDAFERMIGQAIEEEGEALSVGSFSDILSYGSRQQKTVAIAIMTRHFHPVFAPALKQALRDSDNSIRVQAATAMTTIENNFLNQATALDKRARENPEDHSILKDLARHYDEYAFTGVLDPQRAERSRDLALQAYVKYVEQAPRDAEANLALARLLVRSDRHEEAARWLELCRNRGIWAPEMVPWYLESLYKTNRLREVRKFMRENYEDLTRLDRYPNELVEAARLWSGEGVPAASSQGGGT